MNNEIKEILECLEMALDSESYKVLLDYITVLQQDTEMYAQLKDEYEGEIKDLQQENERLQEWKEKYNEKR